MLMPLEKPNFGIRFGGLPDINRTYDILKNMIENLQKENDRVYNLPDSKIDNEPWRDVSELMFTLKRLRFDTSHKSLIDNFNRAEKIIGAIRTSKGDNVSRLKGDFRMYLNETEYALESILDVFDAIESFLRKVKRPTAFMYKLMHECRSLSDKVVRAYNDQRTKLVKEYEAVCNQ